MNPGPHQRGRFRIEGLVRWALLSSAMLFDVAGTAAAQPPAPSADRRTAKAPSPPADNRAPPAKPPQPLPTPTAPSQTPLAADAELTPRVGDLVRVTRSDGQQEWVLYGASLEGFLDFLRNKNSAPRAPDYSISTFSLEGSAD